MTSDALERDYTLSRQAGWFERVSSPVRTAPARYTREQLDAMDRIERRAHDEQRAVWHANLGPIVTPQMQTLFAELDEIIGSNRQDGDRVRGAAVLSALPGLGRARSRSATACAITAIRSSCTASTAPAVTSESRLPTSR